MIGRCRRNLRMKKDVEQQVRFNRKWNLDLELDKIVRSSGTGRAAGSGRKDINISSAFTGIR